MLSLHLQIFLLKLLWKQLAVNNDGITRKLHKLCVHMWQVIKYRVRFHTFKVCMTWKNGEEPLFVLPSVTTKTTLCASGLCPFAKVNMPYASLRALSVRVPRDKYFISPISFWSSTENRNKPYKQCAHSYYSLNYSYVVFDDCVNNNNNDNYNDNKLTILYIYMHQE